jgi:hypothetical protein
MGKDYDPCEWCSCTREQCLECENYSEELDKIVNEFKTTEEEVLSDCCTAPIIYHDICSQCKEHI